MPMAFDERRFLQRAFYVCAVFAVVAVWGHRYPAGIDLPQHANLFRIWAQFRNDPTDYKSFYWIQINTPYLVAYTIGYPITKLFGALAAVKVVLSISAIAAPWAMTRWLRAVGGEPLFGLFGFLLVFGFAYQWGFISHVLATPFMFAYLRAFERQGERPRFRAIAETATWAILLFFCHGISFGVVVLAAGLRCLLPLRPIVMLRRGVHIVPVAVIAGFWLLAQKHRTGGEFVAWPPDKERLIALFSGPFSAFANERWAWVSVAVLILILVAARPALRFAVRAWVPFGVAFIGFLVLPEWLGSTWLVGTRFCTYVHAFAPAVIRVRLQSRGRRRFAWLVLAIVLLGLGTLNFRLFWFNREMAGLTALTNAMEPYWDVRTLVVNTSPDSEAFGSMQFGQTPAWVTAAHGGILENDSGFYFQLPVQRRSNKPFPSRYRYLIARGEADRVERVVRRIVGSVQLIRREGAWFLFEAPPLIISGGDLTIVRSAQGWDELKIDRAVTDAALSVGNVRYPKGLGTHARSYIRVRTKRGAFSRLVGACGIDDAAGERGSALFRIRTPQGFILFRSDVTKRGESARFFSVPVVSGQDLVLEVLPAGGSTLDAHADWVDLKLLP